MRRMLGFLTVIVISSAASAADLFFPDPKDTPGAIYPEVTQANILETVCQSAWLEKIQPSASYVDGLKSKQIEALQLKGGPTDYQEDHLVPLCVGGHPTDPRNLWPEPYSRASTVDQIENDLNRRVCAGSLTLAEAQRRESALKHQSG